MFLNQRNCQRRVTLLYFSRDSQSNVLKSRVYRYNPKRSLRQDTFRRGVTCLSSARWLRTSSADEGCSTVSATTPSLKIPPLCHAILSKVFPRMLTWSIPRLVTPVQLGLGMIFVPSYSPPTPTSIIAVSTYVSLLPPVRTFISRNACQAISVRYRK